MSVRNPAKRKLLSNDVINSNSVVSKDFTSDACIYVILRYINT